MVDINCKNLNRDISNVVCLQITIVGIKNMLVQASPLLYRMNNQLNLALLLVIAVMYAWVLIKHLGEFLQMKKMTFAILAILLLSFVVTIVLFPNNLPGINAILFRTIPFCFLTFFYIARLETLEWLDFYMKKNSIIILIFGVISAFLIKRIGHITESAWDTYSMPLSYVTLIAVMWQLSYFFRSKKVFHLLLSAIGILIIIVYGSRNPLLAIVAFVVIKVLYNSFSNKSRYRVLYLLLVIIGTIALINYKEILTIANQILLNRGISSRTLILLTQDTISSSGRDVIHASLWRYINENPITGLGICGDRAVIGESAHSLYISFFVTYGYLLGSALLIALVHITLRAYKKSSGINRDVLLIYMCLVFPRGFTGGEMWTSDVFWWLLGIIIASLTSCQLNQFQYTRDNYDKSIACN